MSDHVFISYSTADALDFARKLANKLEGGTPSTPVWFDKDDLKAGREWDIQIDEALKSCKLLLFVMTKDSTHDKSVCRQEWSRALSFKKIIVPLWVDNDIDVPFRLANRQRVDFRGDFDRGLAQLRDFLMWLDSPEGILQGYKDRLLDAERDLQRASEVDKLRIQADIKDLKEEIKRQEKIVANPKAAEEQTKKNIETGLERERKPELPLAGIQSTKFINPPPGIAPNYFQDRTVETKQVFDFLHDDAQRLMTIVGRGGVGKTAMICRLLKHLENSAIPEDLQKAFSGIQPLKVDGIVYLSESGSHHVNFTNIFYDLCKLLPKESAQELDTVYKNPQASTESKMRHLLEHFTSERVVLLLDNFEPLVDAETFEIHDTELNEALLAFLNGTHTSVNIIITTRIAPKKLNLVQPGRQRPLDLDDGLESPYAENILREMDSDGRLGLKSASDESLKQAKEKTRGFPKALEALFAILASDRYTTLEELLAMPTPENVVEALVGEAFNRLDTNAQKVMQALAVYNRPVTPAAVDYLLAPHIPAMDSAPILQRLANMHFARKENGRFYLHPVDREFAFGLIPVEDLTAKSAKDAKEEQNVLTAKNTNDFEEEADSVIKVEPDDVISASETNKESIENSLKELEALLAEIKSEEDSTIKETDDVIPASETDDESLENSLKELEALLAEIKAKETNYHLLFTKHDLVSRAADYFAQARKPRAEWKKLEDLSAQLAEFDLRCAAGDYDTAASVLAGFDHEYLLTWGHYRLLIELHLRVKDNVADTKTNIRNFYILGLAYQYIGQIEESIALIEKGLDIARAANIRYFEGSFINILGSNYFFLGNLYKSIEFLEMGLAIVRETSDRGLEAATLGNLGNRYAELGDINKAIEFHKKSLFIKGDISDLYGEGVTLGNLARCCADAGQYPEAIQFGVDGINIGVKLSSVNLGNFNNYYLAYTYLLAGNLFSSKSTVEKAIGYDEPKNNHNASALHGIIALRQGDEVTARGAFLRAIGQADEILSKTAEYYSALDAKGLSICGLAICDLRLGRGAETAPNADGANTGRENDTGRGDPAPTVDDAIETFRKARRIAPHAGVVKSVLQLFDELVKCDTEGILKGVRKAVEGK
jgi:tetratricopeptide (TPR) repeat protein